MAMEEMPAPGAEWQIALSNLSLPLETMLLGGIQQTRDYLRAAGTQGGLFWAPTTRSRLFAEVCFEDWQETFQNESGGVHLFAGLESSHSQPLTQVRTTQQVREWLLMPQVYKTLLPLRRVQEAIGEGEDDRLLASLYVEALGPREKYDDENAPFRRALTISPDLAYKKGFSNVAELVAAAKSKGIGQFIFSTLHSVRPAQDDPHMRLDPWQDWLPQLIRNRELAGVAVSFGRNDLKPPSAAMGATFDQMHEILSDEPDDERLGELPIMLQTIQSETADMPGSPKPLVILRAGATVLKEAGWEPAQGQHRLADFVVKRLSSRR
jgi:hypothetical protein